MGTHLAVSIAGYGDTDGGGAGVRGATCRFHSCALGRDHLRQALIYVDLNPVRAGMVPAATDYPWSSAGTHAEGRDDSGLLDLSLWRQVCPRGDWGEVIRQPEISVDAVRQLREATKTGCPWGEAEFVERMERQLGRKLRRGSPGRPPKSKALGAGGG